MEFLTYQERLRDLGLFSLEKTWGYLSNAYENLVWTEMEPDFSNVAQQRQIEIEEIPLKSEKKF